MGDQKATWPSDMVERLRAFDELGPDSVPSMLDELECILEERHPQLLPLRELLASRSTRLLDTIRAGVSGGLP